MRQSQRSKTWSLEVESAPRFVRELATGWLDPSCGSTRLHAPPAALPISGTERICVCTAWPVWITHRSIGGHGVFESPPLGRLLLMEAMRETVILVAQGRGNGTLPTEGALGEL